MKARIDFEGKPALAFEDPNERNLVAEVSHPEVRVLGKGNPIKILSIDCGVKNNILRMLVKKGAEVRLYTWLLVQVVCFLFLFTFFVVSCYHALVC